MPGAAGSNPATQTLYGVNHAQTISLFPQVYCRALFNFVCYRFVDSAKHSDLLIPWEGALKGPRKPLLNPLQRKDSTREERKRFILKSASGGFGYGSRIKPKITLAPVPSLDKPEKK